MLEKTQRELSLLWCALMHDSVTWPIHGKYQCRSCGRRYPVQWSEADQTVPGARSLARANSYRSALLPLIGLLVLLPLTRMRAANLPLVEASAGASRAFALYITGLERMGPWSVEAVDIDASLPKLAKQGRLRAIRRARPLGEPEYQILEVAGDATVRRQVIARYLSAEKTAAAMPPSSLAVTPANYEFRYRGVESGSDGRSTYIFQIKPRKKREGLFRGELWLDGETGAAVRLSGYLVKSSSIFVKRVTLTRETNLHDGVAIMRLTHLSVDTRLVGPAELVIQESPYPADDGIANDTAR